MGTKVRSRLGDNYKSLGTKESTDPLRPKRTFSVACTASLCRPLRIFQFLTILLLFALVIFMTAKSATSKPIHLSHPASILLIILTASYLFFIAIDMINQFGGHGLPDSPMFLFSFLGVVLFAIAGALMIHYRDPEDHLWALILSQILCFIISILFLIEITILIAYWRQKCLSWKRCYPYTPAGTCGQREIKTIFTRDGPRDIDIERGRCDLATSVSRCKIPLETTADSAVDDHACRKIGIGHRRQYVDCQSSVPALTVVQIAQIQTETGLTSITESQTARTEMIESTMQTASRCDLCNRQMEGVPPTLSISSPPPSPQSQSRYPSQIQAQLPQFQSPITQLQAPVTQLPVETTPYNVPQSPNLPSLQIQHGNCALCPAFYHMRGGIPIGASPCCQSCNCGATTPERPRQAVPYLLEQSSQRLQSGSQSDWPQQQTSTSTMTNPLIENDSDSATPVTTERSEVERVGSNLVVDETDRYRPIKKLPRVYETRPCPTHGAGLAARMAGLPETVTKVTLSSICIRRNKRTQTPAKKSEPSKIKGDAEKDRAKEDPVVQRSFVDKPEGYRSGDLEGSIASFRNERVDLTNRTLSDVRVRIISEEEMRRRSRESRRSGYSSPIKPIRDSEVLLEETELELGEEIDADIERRPESRFERMSSVKPEPSGKLLWQSDRSEPRISVPMGKEVSWPREDSAIIEEPDSELDIEKSRKLPESVHRESRITFKEEPTTPEDSELSLREDEPSDSSSSKLIRKASKKMSKSSQESRRRSRISSSPASRLRLEKSGEDSKISKFRVGESSGVIPRTKSRSRSKVRVSKAGSEVPSGLASRNRSKGRLSKADSEISSGSRSRSSTKERPSKADSKMPLSSKGRLSKDSKISSGSTIRSRSKERLSKIGTEITAGSKGRLTKEDSKISSESMIRSRSEERLSETDSGTPTSSKTEMEESRLRLERSGEDFRPSKGRLSREDSEISSGSMFERLSKAESETPSDSKTLMEEPLLRLEKAGEDSAGSKRRVDVSKSSIPATRSRSRGTSKGLLDKTESLTQSVSNTRKDDFSEASIGKRRGEQGSSKRRVADSESSIPLTRSQSRDTSKGLLDKAESTQSGSITRKDEFREVSIDKRRSEKGSSIIRSPGSKTSAISQESAIELEDTSKSYSDWPDSQRKLTDRETSSSSKESIQKYEDDDPERDIEGWREELAKEMEANESEIFVPSNKVSRTKPKKERSSRISEQVENIDEPPRRSSTQQNIPGVSKERLPQSSRSETPRKQSKKSRTKSTTKEFAYAPAPWSSKGNILQSRSRVDPESRISFDQARMPDCDPHTGMETALPVPDCTPAWQCIENPECPTSGMATDYDCVPSACHDETACVDPCSCRLQQGSIARRQQPVRYFPTEQSSINYYDTEVLRRQCPIRELRCPRGIPTWGVRRQQQPPPEDRNSRSKETKKRITFNLCYVS